MSHGRIKPLDSVARNSLLMIYGKQKLRNPKLTAIEWLNTLLVNSEEADQLEIFPIKTEVLRYALGYKDRKYISYKDLFPQLEYNTKEAEKVEKIESVNQTYFQKEILLLFKRVSLYIGLKHSFFTQVSEATYKDFMKTHRQIVREGLAAVTHPEEDTSQLPLAILHEAIQQYQALDALAHLRIIPPMAQSDSTWHTLGSGLILSLKNGNSHPYLDYYANAFDALKEKDITTLVLIQKRIHAEYMALYPNQAKKIIYEERFNRIQPFYKAIALYVGGFCICMLGFLFKSRMVTHSGKIVIIMAFLIHSLGLLTRMIIESRPPVTNLYSSAIFVGWVIALLGILFGTIFKNRVGVMLSAVGGFLSLIVAHHLSLNGDTMEMMRAVLDSNFLLSTHVVSITIGYSSTYLAGLLGISYLCQGLFTTTLRKELRREYGRMVYGIICFSLLFSFIGTVLGGFWGDQSWGRFWGWDPKENAALLLLLWNAIILHLKGFGFIKVRGMMLAAIFGNIVTSFSWFGVNMLGVGLHSYGFMEKGFFWLGLFFLSQIFFMCLGLLPTKYWKSSY